MPHDHDAVYRRLFRHQSMVEDLIRRFIGGDWVRRLDFTTLELMPTHYVSDELRSREDDRVWRLRLRRSEEPSVDESSWVYLYVVLEFQSTSDQTMALRLLVYLGLLYQDIARDLPAGRKLPPVLPVVLYNGKRPWTAPRRLQDLVDRAPPELAAYQPTFMYLLFDETRHPTEQLQADDSPVSAVFRLEQARTPEALASEIGRIIDLVESHEDLADLRQEFLLWLRRVILPRRFPDTAVEKIRDLEELRTMLEETVEQWTRDWREQGRAEGYAQGIEQGVQQGIRQGVQQGIQQGVQQGRAQSVEAMRSLFRRMVELRFGALASNLHARIDTASADEIERWSSGLASAEAVDDLFGVRG